MVYQSTGVKATAHSHVIHPPLQHSPLFLRHPHPLLHHPAAGRDDALYGLVALLARNAPYRARAFRKAVDDNAFNGGVKYVHAGAS